MAEKDPQCDQPVFQESRATKTGFLLSDARLRDFVPTPEGKRMRPSDIWDHGEALSKRGHPGSTWFLCRTCFDSRPSVVKIYDITEATTAAVRHLRKSHKLLARAGMKRSSGQMDDFVERVEKHRSAPLERTTFDNAFVSWAVCDDISLRQASSARLNHFLTAINPAAGDLHKTSKTSIRDMILGHYNAAKQQIKGVLAMAVSKIHLSIDAWTSDSKLPLLGICAHFVAADYELKTALIALPFIHGRHTGITLSRIVLEVIQEYEIEEKVGYFMMDNASNNDTMMEELQKSLPGLDVCQRRLRCLGHIVNLVCKAMLHGTDAESFEKDFARPDSDKRVEAFERKVTLANEEQRLDAWRKKGAIGKGHNFVIHVNYSESRRQAFKAKQKEADESATMLYELLVDGGVRWNSAYVMVERLLQLKDAVTLYQQAQSDLADTDILTPSDWVELSEFRELLKPFAFISTQLQGNATKGVHGALWEYLPAMDYLFDKLEHKKSLLNRRNSHSHIRTCVNLGWKKLDDYYNLSDDTSAYRAAVLVHPEHKLEWFQNHWGEKTSWLEEVKRVVARLFHDYLAGEPAHPAQPEREMNDFERFNKRRAVAVFGANELDRYLNAPTEDVADPLQWWRLHRQTYPVLSQMAFDLLAVPAMSSECERAFSKAGHVLNESRLRTREDYAEANQCLRAWILAGLVSIVVPP